MSFTHLNSSVLLACSKICDDGNADVNVTASLSTTLKLLVSGGKYNFTVVGTNVSVSNLDIDIGENSRYVCTRKSLHLYSFAIIEMLYRLNVFVTVISLLFRIVYNFLNSSLRRAIGSYVSISNVVYYNKCTKCSN